MTNSSGVRVRNIIGLLGFLAQQEPGKVRQIGELRESFEGSCLHEGDRTKKGGASRGYDDATRGKLNAILDVHKDSWGKQKLFPIVLGGLSNAEGDGRGKRWVVEPVLNGDEMRYLAMFLEGDVRTDYEARRKFWKKLTLMNRSFTENDLVNCKAAATTAGKKIHSPSSKMVFENLAMLNGAIEGKKCVTFGLCRYSDNGQLQKTLRGSKGYRTHKIAPLRLRSSNGRFFLEGKYAEPEAPSNEEDKPLKAKLRGKTYSFLVDMVCNLAYWDGESAVAESEKALGFDQPDELGDVGIPTVKLRLYAMRLSEEAENSGLSTPMEKLRNQLFTRFDGRAYVETVDDKSDDVWETAVAVIKGVDEYELDNWAPYVRGQMHEALGTVDPTAGNKNSSPSALNMPYAVRQ